MTRTERKMLQRATDCKDWQGVSAILLRAEHAATIRKANRLRKQWEAFSRRYSQKPVIAMADYWRAAGRFDLEFKR